MARAYAHIILPVPLPKLLTYCIPDEWDELPEPGCRVVAPLGASKLHTGIIHSYTEKPEEGYVPRELISQIDTLPVVTPSQIKWWEWLAEYYLCTLGEVMLVALPSGLKLETDSWIERTDEAEINWEVLSDREFLIMEALDSHPAITLGDVSKMLGIKTIQPILRSLVEKGLIQIGKEVKSRFKPKVETFVQLAPEWDDEKRLEEFFSELMRAPRQMEILTNFIRLSNRYARKIESISKKALLDNGRFPDSAYKELVKKGVLKEERVEIGRLKKDAIGQAEMKPLSSAQQQALIELNESFKSKNTSLLYGVTSSGKTEIYSYLIQEQVNIGKQVLFLLPEIALTTQLIQRLQRLFPGFLGMYHSRLNENERVEIWRNVLQFSGESSHYQVIVGARSALFLPFQNLGLIIVDEEHDSSYKQQDPAPRYNARDAAQMLAARHGAKVLLGSATPSLESFHLALSGKYGFVKLMERYGNAMLPEITTENLSTARKQKNLIGHFTPGLVQKITEVTGRKEQVILFQNRRGFSLVTQCQKCGWVPQCKNCDISLTYHKHSNHLRCHYCGYSEPMPGACRQCQSTELSQKGFGTEKVEEEFAESFPDLTAIRMDLDTTRRKFALEEILRDFADQSAQVLIGTQMVSKGLDFENVALVGVLNADNLLYYPDFRSYEKAYQLLAQVAGRAGRRTRRGIVIIQTYQPEHEIIKQVIQHNYEGMYQQEMQERHLFEYPPFTRLISITLRAREYELARDVSKKAAEMLQKKYVNQILGPEVPSIAKIKNRYYFRILIKIPRAESSKAIKANLKRLEAYFKADLTNRPVEWIFDVDPL